MDKRSLLSPADGFVIDAKPQTFAAQRKRKAAQAASRERELERLVFGDEAELTDKLGREGDSEGGDSEDEGGVDAGGARAQRAGAPSRGALSRAAAWVDEDDDKVTVDLAAQARTRKLRRTPEETAVRGRDYERRLREHFNQTHGNVAWARKRASRPTSRVPTEGEEGEAEAEGDEGDEGDEDEGLMSALRSTKPLVRKSGLSAVELRVSRLCDANAAERSDAVVQAIDFHPTSELLLTAGLDRTLRLFRIDGTENPKVQGVFFQDLPLTAAAFTRDGAQALVCGRGKHFFIVDLNSGAVSRRPPFVGNGAPEGSKALDKLALSADGAWLAISAASSGAVLLCSARSKQHVATLRMNRDGSALAFAGAGGSPNQLWTGSKAGEVYLWDVRSSRCVQRFRDEGQSDTLAIAADCTGRQLAVGSASGIVNVYDAAQLVAHEGVVARPLKVVQNLTTGVSTLAFNHDGRLLALASKHKRNALRLLHAPTLKMYANWPTSKTPLRYTQCVAFHPRGHYVATGNDRGNALLYKLHAWTDV